MKGLDELQEGLKMIGGAAEGLIEQIQESGVSKYLTPEQKKVLSGSKNAFDLSGIDLSKEGATDELNKKMEGLTNLTNNLQNVVNANK